MAKYAYAPLSVDEQRRKPHGSDSERDRDQQLMNERMPMCVGICVLLAIVFVLSRTGGGGGVPVPVPRDNNGGATAPASVHTVDAPASVSAVDTGVPETTTTTPETTPRDVATPNSASSAETDSAASTSTTATATHPNPQDATTTTTTTIDNASSSSCDCSDPANLDMGAIRQKLFAGTPPHIIECAAADANSDQSACHLPSRQRYAALGQKGATLWMTGCSGAGKTTIATALEDRLVTKYGKHVYRLDGDNLRTGLNRDLSFSAADRAESVRRTGEIATLFSDAGVITLVGLISPYAEDRDTVRKRHEDQGIPFYEVFLDVPVDELKKRDPKGQYARVESGELKHFTCIDDRYDPPVDPEITLKTHKLAIEESVDVLFRRLEADGILVGAPKVTPKGLPNPDGDEMIDLHTPEDERGARTVYAATLPKVLLSDIDLNWLQTVGEGWAAPLKGFMREGTLLETLHFNSITVDPFNLTDNKLKHETRTDFANFPEFPPPDRVSMSVPITLTITDLTKKIVEDSGSPDVALVTTMGHTVAILKDHEIYDNRKEEIATRLYGAVDPGHPYIKKHVYGGGDFLMGGEVELLDRITYNDGLDKWRKTATELAQEFNEKGADTVYAFQTRNPTHAGHAYLMRSAGERLRTEDHYKKPVLWLSPLGGWTKDDDVPLDVRVKQHEEVLKTGTSHPGGLDPDSTVMAIWPAPMVYAGPTEVQFHAKSRRSAGASYFVVGRDPAGIKGSEEAVAHPLDDLYDGDHGRYVLQNSPGIGNMKMISFVKVMYDVKDNVMKVPDESRMEDFISISGTKMRQLARNGATLCDEHNLPSDLIEANCVPSGFMVPQGWDGVVDYYKHTDDKQRWVPWSKPKVEAPKADDTRSEGEFGSVSFELHHNRYKSWWHDVPMRPGDDQTVINLVTEIPMYVTTKMEVNKEAFGNAIKQDVNKDGSPRHYTYGVPFFNYGLVSQTWEDPELKDAAGHAGDNDPLDVVEVGSTPLRMGSVTPCRVLGSLELIDDGETDHKILCIALDDPDADRIRNAADLESVKPGHVARLVHWLKRYKTSDGKPENALTQEVPTSVEEAVRIIEETHERWSRLCWDYSKGINKYGFYMEGCSK